MSALDTDDGKRLMKQVTVGLDAEAFLRSDFGEYVMQRMIAQHLDALEALQDVNPTCYADVIAAQNEARIPKMVLQLISDCVTEGKQAEHQLLATED